MKLPRVMISAGASGSGKTFITCGLLQTLRGTGKDVCSFKCGPDYIDPMFHRNILGTKTGNLDTFFTAPDVTRHLMAERAGGCQMAVLEGVMGYYDGLGGTRSDASSYDVAKATKTPVILIVDAKGMSASAAAFINGFKDFKTDSNIQGIILNKVSKSVYLSLRDYIEDECGVKVVGYLPEIKDCVFESRYLGLMLPNEIDDLKDKLDKLSSVMRETIDLDLLMKIADKAADIATDADLMLPKYERVRVAVARDEAFCFIYEENIELLKNMGADIVEFSPIHDDELPEDMQGMILYGGYPENYAEKLSRNDKIKTGIKKAVRDGMPIIAECGGFMYLHENFEGNDGREYDGVGLIKGKCFKTPKLTRFGYVHLTENENTGGFFSGFGKDVGSIPAHEFHYYDSTANGRSFTAEKPVGGRKWQCIHSTENILAGFPHMYYYGNPHVAEAFLCKCVDRMERHTVKGDL